MKNWYFPIETITVRRVPLREGALQKYVPKCKKIAELYFASIDSKPSKTVHIHSKTSPLSIFSAKLVIETHSLRLPKGQIWHIWYMGAKMYQNAKKSKKNILLQSTQNHPKRIKSTLKLLH